MSARLRICRKSKIEVRKLFEATLRNRSQPELGSLTISFPIPEERYENVIFALKNFQIGDAGKQDCCIDSIRAPDCPALCRMSGTLANVDELDWLGRKLESFDQYELLQVSAAAERFGLCSADELVDLSFCANEMTVISDFSDLERVGRKHYLTVNGAADTKELENLDGKETALALIFGNWERDRDRREMCADPVFQRCFKHVFHLDFRFSAYP